MCCQTDEVVFLICRFFFYLQCVSLFGCVVSICRVCCQIDQLVFNLHVFLFEARFFTWLCCEHL